MSWIQLFTRLNFFKDYCYSLVEAKAITYLIGSKFGFIIESLNSRYLRMVIAKHLMYEPNSKACSIIKFQHLTKNGIGMYIDLDLA